MKTFFTKNINNDIVVLTNDEHNHLKNVMRLNVGDKVKVVCGDRYNYFCTISNISKNKSILTVDYKELNSANPKVKLTCYMALIKNDNLSLIVQKLTELGCTNFVPFESQYTVNKDKGTKADKLSIITEQSIKQCGRSIPMNISSTYKLKDLDQLLGQHDLIVFANETEKSVPLQQVLDNNNDAKDIAIIVGCEGGFAPDEIKFLIDNNAKSVTLGSRILRAETASIMLSAIILNHFKEYC